MKLYSFRSSVEDFDNRFCRFFNGFEGVFERLCEITQVVFVLALLPFIVGYWGLLNLGSLFLSGFCALSRKVRGIRVKVRLDTEIKREFFKAAALLILGVGVGLVLLLLSGCATAVPSPASAVAAETGLVSIGKSAATITASAGQLPASPQKETIKTAAGAITTTVPQVRGGVEDLERLLAQSKAEVASLRAEVASLNERTNFWTVLFLRLLGVGLLLWAGFRIYSAVQSGGAAVLAGALKGAGTLVILGVTLIGLSSLLEASWFWTACYTVTGISVVGAIAYLGYDTWRAHKASAGEAESDTLLGKIVTAIDENSTVENLKLALSAVMTPEEKVGVEHIKQGLPWA